MTENAIKKALECSRLHSKLADEIMSGEITENKVSELTDNETTKILERCSDGTGKGIIKATLDLIKRKDEQIEALIAGQETLQKYIAEKDAEIDNLNDLVVYNASCATKLQIKLVDAKSEAVKEFAERLKGNKIDIDVSFGYGREVYTEAVAVVEIDNLVKEMVGDSE